MDECICLDCNEQEIDTEVAITPFILEEVVDQIGVIKKELAAIKQILRLLV